jgi:hypothetical protein
MDLAPPGLDELFAVLSIVERCSSAAAQDIVVLDTRRPVTRLRLLGCPRPPAWSTRCWPSCASTARSSAR